MREISREEIPLGKGHKLVIVTAELDPEGGDRLFELRPGGEMVERSPEEVQALKNEAKPAPSEEA